MCDIKIKAKGTGNRFWFIIICPHARENKRKTGGQQKFLQLSRAKNKKRQREWVNKRGL